METKDNYQWFKDWILSDNHPCIMAQTVFRMDHVDYHEYNGFGTSESVNQMMSDLQDYIDKYDFTSNDFFSFIAAFPSGGTSLSEKQFEDMLWSQLEYLHKSDDTEWDKNVDPNPEDANFSFSLKGCAFYMVGLHPNASRMARHAPFPTIVFNLHSQFEKLRDMHVYKQVRNRIRRRDKRMQGAINPVLQDFGDKSEARQ